eukprot:3005383-Pleurochrysis_carterae.AAC.1
MCRCAFPSWTSLSCLVAHGGTVIQRSRLCLCLHGVVVCSGSSWPCCYNNEVPSPHITLALRATVVAATASCNYSKRRGTAVDSGSVTLGYQGLNDTLHKYHLHQFPQAGYNTFSLYIHQYHRSPLHDHVRRESHTGQSA